MTAAANTSKDARAKSHHGKHTREARLRKHFGASLLALVLHCDEHEFRRQSARRLSESMNFALGALGLLLVRPATETETETIQR